MSGYRVLFSPDARTALDGLRRDELVFVLGHLQALALRPSAYSEPAGPTAFPGEGMSSKAVMPTSDGDAVYFVVNFRFSTDETALVVSSIHVFRPPVEDDDSD